MKEQDIHEMVGKVCQATYIMQKVQDWRMSILNTLWQNMNVNSGLIYEYNIGCSGL